MRHLTRFLVNSSCRQQLQLRQHQQLTAASTVQRRWIKTSSEEAELPESDRTVAKKEVERFIVDCMVKVGTDDFRAEMLAGNLTEADYRGHFSHGLSRLAMYVQDIQAGMCQPNSDPRVLSEGPATAWVDGCNGLGVVVGTFAMQLAIRKAKEAGVGWVVAKGSNHFGICQWYGEMARRAGLVGMASTNTSPLVTPTRAGRPVFGTNPWCVAAPTSAEDEDEATGFLLDMSTSTTAVGKIEIQMRKKEPLPSLGWALGTDGTPTTDAHQAFHNGSGLMPLGGEEVNSGYKGYGLAMMVELMTSVMGGAAVAPHVRKWGSFDKPANMGQLFVAIDPQRFCPGMPDRLSKLAGELREMEPIDPAKPVLVPGDPEKAAMRGVKERNGGIIYTSNHIHTYKELADELDVAPMKALTK